MFPPYSPKAKKNANTLRFTPPGFKHPIYVPFTGRRLAVCERCKKNFKTRDHCRTRDCHVDLPWSETFVCVSLDNTCLDENGDLLDGPFYASAVPPIAFNFSGEIDRKTPICAPCKDKNYTRTYCRHQKRHRQLPWSTVYVVLTLTPDSMYGGDYREAASPSNTSTKRRKTNIKDEDADNNRYDNRDSNRDGKDDTGDDEGKVEDRSEKSKDATTESIGSEKDTEARESKIGEKNNNELVKDDINNTEKEKRINEEEEAKKMENIPSSRTLLATVSCKGCTIEWLELDPVLQSQYPHLKSYSSNKYEGESFSGPPMMSARNMGPMNSMGPMNPMGMGQMGMMGNMGMGQMGPMGMNMMNFSSYMGGNMGGHMAGHMGGGGDMMGGGNSMYSRGGRNGPYQGGPEMGGGRQMVNFEGGGSMHGGSGGGGPRGSYSNNPHEMQMLQYEMMNRRMSGNNSSSPGSNNANSPMFESGNRGGQNMMMNRGQWGSYGPSPDYSDMNFGMSRGSGNSGGGGNSNDMMQSQGTPQMWQQHPMGGYNNMRHPGGMWPQMQGGQGSDRGFTVLGDKDGQGRQRDEGGIQLQRDSDDNFDRSRKRRRDSDPGDNKN